MGWETLGGVSAAVETASPERFRQGPRAGNWLRTRNIASVAALISALDDYRIGEQVSVRVWRSGHETGVAVVLKPES